MPMKTSKIMQLSFYDTVLETGDKNQSRKKSPLIIIVIRIHLATLGLCF